MEKNQTPYFSKTAASSIAETTKKCIKYSHKHFLQMKMVVQYICNLLMIKK